MRYAMEPIGRVVAERVDTIHGTPVIDLKPVMTEFLPRGDVNQPEWSPELMRDYWKRGAG